MERGEEQMVKNSFIIAGLVTFVVFSSGMLLQWNLDQRRTDDVLQRINDLELTTNSLLVEKELVEVLDYKACTIQLQRSRDISKDVDRLGSVLESYRDSSIFDESRYKDLKHQYLLLEIFYWAKLLESKKLCDDANYVTVLYFYNEKCDACKDQGLILTELKKEYGEKLMIFSVDTDFASVETNVNTLVKEYNVTATPTIVIDQYRKLENFISRDRLNSEILAAGPGGP